MEFQDVVQRRRMVRAFEERPVPPDVLDRILANAIRAPSAGFSQGWAFLVLGGTDETSRFWSAAFAGASPAGPRWTGIARAPVLVVALAHKQAYLDRYAAPDQGWTDRSEERWPVPYWDIDTGFAAMLMLLTAVDAGLGALFFGFLPERVDAFRAAFGVPPAFRPIGAIALGYPAPDTPSASLRRGRRPVAEVVHRGRW